MRETGVEPAGNGNPCEQVNDPKDYHFELTLAFMERRTYLTLIGSAAGLAGCTGGTSAPRTTATPTPTPGPAYDPAYAREHAVTPSRTELFRNVERYEGDPVHFEYGQVYQVVHDDPEPGTDFLLIYVANNRESWEGDVAAHWTGEERLARDDLIELWGVVERLYTYTTDRGNERTIPLLTLVDFERYRR